MKLSNDSLKNTQQWIDAGFSIPTFNRDSLIDNTTKNPCWLHFGAGNIFRGFPAVMQQTLIELGESSTGIIVAEAYDTEIIEKVYKPYDNLGVLVTLKSNNTIDKKVIASLTESLVADIASDDWKRLKDICINSSLQMMSFTITEKGYAVVDAKGVLYPPVAQECLNGPDNPLTLMGKITALCYARFCESKQKNISLPIALVSMDNCSHNGSKLHDAVLCIAKEWNKNSFVNNEFIEWLDNPQCVSFPWSMIDKITPRPNEKVQAILKQSGFEDTEIIVTNKNTWIAPFVNAEETGYLIIEDSFPHGRPCLEKAGVIFTDKQTVDRVEKMKVCTCLNPLHTALAIFGCLLGYTAIYEEMNNPYLVKMIEKLGYQEGMPVVVNPEIINPKDFLREVLEVRLPNPFMPDTPQRIACDTSQKLSVRFGETIIAISNRKDLSVQTLEVIPLVFAGWCRYLMGLDDNGNVFELSPDPLLEKSRAIVSGFKLGNSVSQESCMKILEPLLSDTSIFGVNLYTVGLAEKVCAYFIKMISGTGAVLQTIKNC